MKYWLLFVLIVLIVLVGGRWIRAQSLAINVEPAPTVSAPPPLTSPAGSPGIQALRYAECPFCHLPYMANSKGVFLDHEFVQIRMNAGETYETCITEFVAALRRITHGRVVKK